MRFPGGFSGRTGEGSHLVEGICLKGYMPERVYACSNSKRYTPLVREEGGEGRSETPVDLDVKSVSEKLRRFLRTAVVSAVTGRFVRA